MIVVAFPSWTLWGLPNANSEHRFPAPSSKLCQIWLPRSCPATRSAPSERFGYCYDCRSNLAPKHARKHETHPHRVEKEEKEFRLDSNDCGFICAGVNFVGGYKWHALFYLSCLEQTYYCFSTNKKLLVSWQFSGLYGITKYGSGWRKDVVNQCLEFVLSVCCCTLIMHCVWRTNCVCGCFFNLFLLPYHMGNHTPSSEDL